MPGLNQLQAQYQKEYGPGNYVPNVFIQYWSMRVMAYLASLIRCSRCGAAGCCTGARLERSKWFLRVAPWAVITPVPHEHRRLDADRERAPAVDRAGADEDGQRRLAVGDLHRHLDQP